MSAVRKANVTFIFVSKFYFIFQLYNSYGIKKMKDNK